MVIGVPPGGTTDILGRMVVPALSERLGKQVVIDNRSGASGSIAITLVVKSQPDGHTLSLAGASITTVGSLYSKLPFDVAKDLIPVAAIASTPYVLAVNPTLPVHSISDLVGYAASRPEGVNFGASTPGTLQHLSGELLKRVAGMNISYVPYKGTGALLPDLLGGRLPVVVENIVTLRPLVRSGQVRGLGVTSMNRSAVLPELPTIAESGVAGFQAVGRFVVFTPAKTPRAIVDRLNTEIAKVIDMPQMRERLLVQGAEPGSGRPEQLRAEFLREIALWGNVIREAGIKVE
jgi:tripartite-type tricarboxylate transporter receptor subunit TctC